ncbi:MAG: M28 family peptidase [Candidatus Methylomirabilales bacterium]
MHPFTSMGQQLIALCWWLLVLTDPRVVLAGLSGDQPVHDKLAKALAGVSGTRMLADVAHLSSADLNGRQTGTTDDLRSGLLVAERFQSLGLQPGGTEVLQPLPHPWATATAVTATQIGGITQLELSSDSSASSGRLGEDYLPILDSPSVNVTAPVVFVGYGISDPTRGFDEYAGVDVQKRIVLFFRGKPEGYPAPVSQAEKVRVAREKGAIAFLTLTGPILSAYESRRGLSTGPMAYYGHGDGEHTLPGCWISPALAEKILSARPRSLREVQETVNRTLTPQSASTGMRAHLAWDSKQAPGTLVNILGVIKGADSPAPSDRNETVLVGAHRDHFGRQAGFLFPGADDNASGTAVLLEVARALIHSGMTPRRSILFASFSGEEQNLLGSRLYVSRPARPLAQTIAMINVDHAGVGSGRLTVGIAGLPKETATGAGQLAGLADKLDLFGFFPGGDHVPFKEAGVPTIAIVSAGAHPHFHQPTDTAETVQPEILQAVARYVLSLTWQLANGP